MKPALATLKYVPAVLCGLLTVAWVVSAFAFYGALWRLPAGIANGDVAVLTNDGSIVFCHNKLSFAPTQAYFTSRKTGVFDGRSWQGELKYLKQVNSICVFVPFGLLLTLLVPGAIAPFNRFRFPLWSYFAWTALIAAELAYYLR